MHIVQTAGGCSVEVEVEGSPFWVNVALTAINGERHKVRQSVSDLHDLRYCIDRALDQLPKHQ